MTFGTAFFLFYFCVNLSSLFFWWPIFLLWKIFHVKWQPSYGCNQNVAENESREIFAHYCQYFAWPRYLPSALPAVPIFNILISPKYEPALSDAMTVFPLSPTTCSRPRFTMYISLPTSPSFRGFHQFVFINNSPDGKQTFTFSTDVVTWREENRSQSQDELA